MYTLTSKHFLDNSSFCRKSCIISIIPLSFQLFVLCFIPFQDIQIFIQILKYSYILKKLLAWTIIQIELNLFILLERIDILMIVSFPIHGRGIQGGDPKSLKFIYKKLCIQSYMFKFQSSSKYSLFKSIHLSRHFFHCAKQFLNSLILMPSSTSAVFYFTSSTLAKHFPLRTFFNNKKKVARGQFG